MTLPKHLRRRWRYLAVGIHTWPDARLSRSAFSRALAGAITDLYGDAGSAALDVRVYGFSFADGYGETVVRVPRGEVERARAAMATVTTIDGASVGLRVRGVSGTVRGCEEKYLGRQPEPPRESTVVFDNAQRSATIRGTTADVAIDDAFVGATLLDLE